jgi:hypothetical protein
MYFCVPFGSSGVENPIREPSAGFSTSLETNGGGGTEGWAEGFSMEARRRGNDCRARR